MPRLLGQSSRRLRLTSVAALLAAVGCGSEAQPPVEPAPVDGAVTDPSPTSSAESGGREGGSEAGPAPAGGKSTQPASGGRAPDRPEERAGSDSGGSPEVSAGGNRAGSGADGSGGSERAEAGSDPRNLGGSGGEWTTGGHPATGGVSGGYAGTGATGNVRNSLPCEVRAVLEQRCQICHRNPPINDAKVSLLTWYDVSNVAIEMQVKLENDEMPPRGQLDLSERQRSTLLDYLALGTPSAGNVSCP